MSNNANDEMICMNCNKTFPMVECIDSIACEMLCPINPLHELTEKIDYTKEELSSIRNLIEDARKLQNLHPKVKFSLQASVHCN